MGKVIEKVVATELSSYCEKFAKLYLRQMRARKQQCAINVVESLIHKVQEYWAERKLSAELFMDVKDAFNYVPKNGLV